MLRVAFPTRNLYPVHGHGGAQRYVQALAKALIAQGVEVVPIVPGPQGYAEERVEGLPVVYMPPAAHLNYGRFRPCYQRWMRHVARYVLDHGFDLVHTFAGGVSFYHGLQGRLPVVFQNFGNELFKATGLRRWVRQALYYRYFQRQFAVADAVASQGPFQDAELQAMFQVPAAKIFRLPSGIDLAHVQACLASEPRLTRQGLGLAAEDLVLISVGRLVPYKGFDQVLRAMATLAGDLPNLSLLLVGAGPDEPRLLALAAELGLRDRVKRLSNLADAQLFQSYALADLAVMASSREGFPLVTLEAMACGLPVIGTNNNENTQVIREGENGLLIPPEDPPAIAGAIRALQDRQKRRRMGERAREIVREYDWAAIARMALAKYEELRGGTGRRRGA